MNLLIETIKSFDLFSDDEKKRLITRINALPPFDFYQPQPLHSILKANGLSDQLFALFKMTLMDQTTEAKSIDFESGDYSLMLNEMFSPPTRLYYEGDVSLIHQPCISVVGTRQMSKYGQEVLDLLVPIIVNQGWVLVSGLARGVDIYAMEKAKALGGCVIGVLGNGIGVYYPKENMATQLLLRQKDLIISEYEHLAQARRFHFPMRNRIIAGLSYATLVVEAKQKSGSLITANLALNENRTVMAVPGSMFNATSHGCHDLIRDGAVMIDSPIILQNELENLGLQFNNAIVNK